MSLFGRRKDKPITTVGPVPRKCSCKNPWPVDRIAGTYRCSNCGGER
jgi:hypothetical protein